MSVTTSLSDELRLVLVEIDERSAGIAPRPVIYLVGAGALVLAGITERATEDLDFLCDGQGDRFVNVITPGGTFSHRVPTGLVCMPAGWRERARPLVGVALANVAVLVPDLTDRMLDKVSRGSATDWDDLVAIVRSPDCPAPERVASRANELLRAPTSSVFDEASFRANYERLRSLFSTTGRTLGPTA
jgi:hypothetical protein